ncbi:Endonuclease/exonuclease/phosphatase [Lenzites betulinus]|nr:Endonuclease/exonuclease/phosphatase [Lenzites betulinus]
MLKALRPYSSRLPTRLRTLHQTTSGGMPHGEPPKSEAEGEAAISGSIADDRPLSGNSDESTLTEPLKTVTENDTKNKSSNNGVGGSNHEPASFLLTLMKRWGIFSAVFQTASSPGPSPPRTPPPPPSGIRNMPASHPDPSLPVTTSTGDLVSQPKLKGFAFTKFKWTSKFRCEKSIPAEIRLVTWNVDFMAPRSDVRFLCILSYLQNSTLSSPPEPACILLQELDAKSFDALLASDWVRKHFAVVPDSTKEWRGSHYGNATLVSRSIPVRDVKKMDFRNSQMGRSAIFVDIPVRLSPDSDELRVVRVANTHLESLPQGSSQRTEQLKAIAELLRVDGVDGGVVGGDMNMIGDTKDQSIHIDAGLQDACLFPDDPASHTWGFQPVSRWPRGRMDRVFFVGEGLLVDSVQVIGKGLRIKNGQWASDHCGLSTTISFSAADI